MKFKTLFAFLVFSLVSAQQGFAQSSPPKYDSGLLLPPNVLPEAYLALGKPDVGRYWNFAVEISALYWQARQKGLDFGYVIPSDPTTQAGPNLYNHFGYHPGVKVGIGMDIHLDGWMAYVEYSRIRISQSVASDAPIWATGIEPLWLPDSNNGGPLISDVSQAFFDWDLKYDMLDGFIVRPSYYGRSLILSPLVGFRGGWMRQNMEVDYTAAGGLIQNHLNQTVDLIGPRTGVQGQLLLGKGLRFDGSTAFALLWQVVGVAFQRENAEPPSTLSVNATDVVRFFSPNLDMSLGLGWGNYFQNKNWFLDISIVYDIHYFWAQNWMRYVKDVIDERSAAETGDLKIHGLTTTIKANF